MRDMPSVVVERISSIEDFQLFGTILKEAPIHEKLPYSKAQIVNLLRTEGEQEELAAE